MKSFVLVAVVVVGVRVVFLGVVTHKRARVKQRETETDGDTVVVVVYGKRSVCKGMKGTSTRGTTPSDASPTTRVE